MLAGDEARDGVHGSRPVESDDGGDVLNALGLEADAHAGHAGGLHLEHAGGLASGRASQRSPDRPPECPPVRNSGWSRLHHFHRVVQHRQVPQAQEVHLQKAQLFQRGHDILADDGLDRSWARGTYSYTGLPGNDHAGGVGRGVAGHSLQRPGGVNQPAAHSHRRS